MSRIFIILLVLVAPLSFAQTINTFPHFEGFEGMVNNLSEDYPEGWTAEDLNTVYYGNQTWQSIKNSTTSQNTHTGETAIHMMGHPSEDNNDWLYTPGIEMQEGEVYTISFWYSAKIIGGTYEQIKVHVATENNAVAMLENTELWLDDNVNSDVWRQAEITYIAETSDVYHFGLHYYSPEFMFVFLLDDITIDGPTISSIAEENTAGFQLLGNPVNSEIRIAYDAQENTTAKLYALDGRLVKTENMKMGSTQLQINVENLPEATYLLKLENETSTAVQQVVIAK